MLPVSLYCTFFIAPVVYYRPVSIVERMLPASPYCTFLIAPSVYHRPQDGNKPLGQSKMYNTEKLAT
jgi:hypothetical protein